jgi:hypothetical protein
MSGDGKGKGARRLTEAERARILARLHMNLSWVGVKVPETIEVDGRQVPLRSTMDRFIFDDHLDEEELAAARWLQRSLERRARELESELAHDELSLSQAEELLERTIGILRAVEELKALRDGAEFEHRRAEVMQEIDDAQRWRKFAKQVYDRDEYY